LRFLANKKCHAENSWLTNRSPSKMVIFMLRMWLTSASASVHVNSLAAEQLPLIFPQPGHWHCLANEHLLLREPASRPVIGREDCKVTCTGQRALVSEERGLRSRVSFGLSRK
jgi:hypothetical protein